jgi:hypothetical protein
MPWTFFSEGLIPAKRGIAVEVRKRSMGREEQEIRGRMARGVIGAEIFQERIEKGTMGGVETKERQAKKIACTYLLLAMNMRAVPERIRSRRPRGKRVIEDCKFDPVPVTITQ